MECVVSFLACVCVNKEGEVSIRVGANYVLHVDVGSFGRVQWHFLVQLVLQHSNQLIN